MITRFAVVMVAAAAQVALAGWLVPMAAAAPIAAAMALKTPVTLGNLDPAAYAEWCDGHETRIEGEAKERAPQWVLWTDTTTTGHSGLLFGVSKAAGPRHLRIGFQAPVSVGSLLVRAGGRVSVLRPGAAYPGDLHDDSQWLAGQRLHDGKLTSTDEAAREDVALWVFPPGTSTRALRFTHTPTATDNKYDGFLGAAMVLEERFGNVAPQATAAASSNNQKAAKINNEAIDPGARGWDNRSPDNPAAPAPVASDAPVVSGEHPEWVLLSWTAPVDLRGLAGLGTGFSAAEVQIYKGPPARHPRDAADEDWETVGNYEKLAINGSAQLWPYHFDFGRVVSTRAVRLRITAPGKQEAHTTTAGGTRVWLGELLALQPLAGAPLQEARPTVAATVDATPQPPIPIRFTLKEPGYVTLVIERKDGFRVRNLVSETYFPAGDNVAWWDGLDDLLRDVDAVKHGVYHIPARFVEPGDYHVRGLVRGAIDPHYEFSVYSTGTPPWSTPDHTGGWLANHTPPMSALFVPAKQSPTGQPAVFLGCYVTEGPDGLAWVDLEGHKLGGKKWIGGNWTAAPYLARDAGEKAVPGVIAYVGSVWETGKKSGVAELRVTALKSDADKPVLVETLGELPPKADKGAEIGGLAVHDGIAVVSLAKRNQLDFVDTRTGESLGRAPLDAPHGLAFDATGRLLALSGTKLLRFDALHDAPKLSAPVPLIATGLEAPVSLTLDAKGNIYVSDRGNSHQVKIFTPEGKFVRAIGHPGAPKAGPYDPLHINNPAGLAVDSNGHLWVTENDYLPKRVSVWTLDGALVQSFYGPGKYGGGGTLDPQDKTRFYYADETRGAMEFKLDWQKGTSVPVNVYSRTQPGDMPLAFRSASPETPLYHDGRRYFTNCYNSSPTSGHPTAFLFAERDGIAHPAAGMGRADSWDVLKGDEFKSRVPEGVDLTSQDARKAGLFLWFDANGDGRAQPDEVTIQKSATGGVTVMPDLSFCVARVDDKAMRYTPVSVGADGIPHYDLSKGETLATGVLGPASSGGNQLLPAPDGWAVLTLGMQPFDQRSFSGTKNGVAAWSYPNLWPGLHASHEAPTPDRPGELNGPTRLLGGLFEPKGSTAGPLWAINCNHGNVYIFTADGLFVATVFKDMRQAPGWNMAAAVRNLSLEGLSLGEENFWPTLTQASDGQVYIVDGARSSLIRLDGLGTVRRLPDSAVNVSTADLVKARAFVNDAEAARQRAHGSGSLDVALRATPPVVDGKADDWAGADWAEIDKSGVKANFNSHSQAYDVTGALAVSGDRLYAVYRTADDALLQNTGEMPVAPFKTGGALDLMLAADPAAKADRHDPASGDMRLLVTVVKDKPYALLYRAVVPGTAAKDKVPFSSPWATLTFDKVDDISAQVQFAAHDGTYEFSVPLAALGLKPPAPGASLKGDLGILRGSGGTTIARVYWSNKATGITADVPSEAALAPGLWGTFRFKAAK